MRICTIYCGGCNPRYDRSKMIEKLIESYKGIEVCYYDDVEECDIVLVLAGCKVSCVSHEHALGKFGKVIVSEPDDYEKIINIIESNYN